MPEDTRIPTPAPADRPTLKILVSGAQISGEYQVKGVVVTRAFNRLSSALVLIYDGDPASETFKASSSQDFIPGKEIEIVAGYHGNETTIFKGIVIRHGLHARNNRDSYLQVECRDRAVRLSVGRKSVYFYDSKDSEIMEQIASGAGLQTDIEATAVIHAQMVQYSATDWDFIVTRAEANGYMVLTRDGTLVVKPPVSSAQASLALTYGRNILDFEAVIDSRDQFDAVQSVAWNASGQVLTEVDGQVPAAVAPGNLTGNDLAAVIGLSPLKLQHAGQMKESELQAWADGQRIRSAFAKVRGRARIQGYGPMMPGDLIELGGLGDRFNGKALVSGLRHEINTRNWETEITFGLSPECLVESDRRVSGAPGSGLLPGAVGLHVGLVTALEGDPDGEDRIQVRVPLIGAGEEGIWARVAALDAGNNRGTFFRPEIDDEVVLGFLGEDPTNPIVLGMMNSSAKPAPFTASDTNPQKGVVTRSRIKVIFDDDKKSVLIETPGGNSVLLDDENGAITVRDQSSNKLVLESAGITIESTGDLILKATGDVKIQGANATMAADAQLQAKGSAGAEFSSGGSTVLKGSIVQIN